MGMTEYRKVANEFNAEVRRRDAERSARIRKMSPSRKEVVATFHGQGYPTSLIAAIAKLPLCKRGHHLGGLNEYTLGSGEVVCKICQYVLHGLISLPGDLEPYLGGQPYEPREKKAGNG
jgi:hypothetical protein